MRKSCANKIHKLILYFNCGCDESIASSNTVQHCFSLNDVCFFGIRLASSDAKMAGNCSRDIHFSSPKCKRQSRHCSQNSSICTLIRLLYFVWLATEPWFGASDSHSNWLRQAVAHFVCAWTADNSR